MHNNRSRISTDIDDPLNEASVATTSGALVSYKRFKNSAGVVLATNGVRKSLNEMTQQFKKNKEMNELVLERKNIENMIVNSKLWSPPFQGGAGGGRGSSKIDGGFSVTTASMRSSEMNLPCTSNVFRDKREELTKILKKRLTYIH